MMYQFVLNMWIMNRITESQIDIYVAKRYISDDEKEMILATPQI